MENKMDEASLVCWVNRILLERFFFGCFRVGKNSKLPRPHCCHDTWQSSESHHHERCVARISSLRFFTHRYLEVSTRGWWSFFFFFPGGEGGIHSEQKPETPQQTSKHLGKRLLSEVFAQNQHRRYPMTFLELDSNLYHLSGLSLQRFVFHWRKTCHPAVDFAAKRKGWAPVNSWAMKKGPLVV